MKIDVILGTPTANYGAQQILKNLGATNITQEGLCIMATVEGSLEDATKAFVNVGTVAESGTAKKIKKPVAPETVE